jgi:hypothetical protein
MLKLTSDLYNYNIHWTYNLIYKVLLYSVIRFSLRFSLPLVWLLSDRNRSISTVVSSLGNRLIRTEITMQIQDGHRALVNGNVRLA